MPESAAETEEHATPISWSWATASEPIVSSDHTSWDGALIRRWSGTSATMVQPSLDHHYVVMHLGGAKHVTRKRDGAPVAAVVEDGSLTIVPAGTAYVWQTRGPIAFGHLYVKPDLLGSVFAEAFEGDGSQISVMEAVGCRDAFLEPLLSTMFDEVREGLGASRLRLDSLLESFCFQLAYKHVSGRPSSTRRTKVAALSAHRLRRVVEFIESHLGEDLSLADLAAAAGSGQAHFSHAFRIATGCSPYRYLVRRRIEYAKVLLLTGDVPLESISHTCGFRRTQQFANMFKHSTGVGPKRFRMCKPIL